MTLRKCEDENREVHGTAADIFAEKKQYVYCTIFRKVLAMFVQREDASRRLRRHLTWSTIGQDRTWRLPWHDLSRVHRRDSDRELSRERPIIYLCTEIGHKPS